LGPETDVRAALGRCGLYPDDAPPLAAEIRQRVSNSVPPGEDVMRALEY
jgi:hypothetical protein